MNLEGRTAIVTGGTGGIGRAMARGFAESGATVRIYQPPGRMSLRATWAMAPLGSILTSRAGDRSRRLVETASTRAGGIDILINNAGVHSTQSFLDVDEAEYDRIFAVNTRGYSFVMQDVARHMIQQGRGGKS